MEISLKLNRLMIKLMDMEPILIKSEPSMRKTVKIISNMVIVRKFGPIALIMKNTTQRERSREESSKYRKIYLCTMKIGMRTELKDTENINGNTVENK
jgi:uncharacterized protein YnzC (UPF0291/DUF896 family)